MFRVVENSKHVSCSIIFFLECHTVYEAKCKKYGTARQAKDKDDNIIWYTRSACWISNATDKTVRICIFIPFHVKSGYKNVSEYYFYTRTVFPVKYISINLMVSTDHLSALTGVPLAKRTPVNPI
jgi:hypothetical protein